METNCVARIEIDTHKIPPAIFQMGGQQYKCQIEQMESVNESIEISSRSGDKAYLPGKKSYEFDVLLLEFPKNSFNAGLEGRLGIGKWFFDGAVIITEVRTKPEPVSVSVHLVSYGTPDWLDARPIKAIGELNAAARRVKETAKRFVHIFEPPESELEEEDGDWENW